MSSISRSLAVATRGVKADADQDTDADADADADTAARDGQ